MNNDIKTVLTIGVVVVIVYFFISPYQNCMRSIKGNVVKDQWSETRGRFVDLTKSSYCRKKSDW